MDSGKARAASSGPRRAPTPDERRVDAERSKAALLDAALEEFSAKGFAGARVRDIADRAGVSKDLIAYHFGGKQGLYVAVQRAWLEQESRFADAELSLAKSLEHYLHAALSDPRPTRLLVWRGLAADGSAPPDASAETDHPGAAGLRRRQDRGELDPNLDPATLQLVLLGAVAAPVIFPEDVRRLFGVDAAKPEFEARYRAGLLQIIRSRGAPPAEEDRP
ncbi:MAG: TetR/AcrR family transcriptional regulator [Chloroflexota bacterium]